MTIRLLNTGTFFADGGAMFGAVPRSAWGRRYPFNYRNDCKLAMLAGLITTDDGRVILIDNGYGTKRPEPFTRTALAFHHIQDPAQTLARLGIPLYLPANSGQCCGAAGTYALLQPQTAGRLKAEKLTALNELQPDIILSANIGCIAHLGGGRTPVRHWIEYLDELLA